MARAKFGTHLKQTRSLMGQFLSIVKNVGVGKGRIGLFLSVDVQEGSMEIEIYITFLFSNVANPLIAVMITIRYFTLLLKDIIIDGSLPNFPSKLAPKSEVHTEAIPESRIICSPPFKDAKVLHLND